MLSSHHSAKMHIVYHIGKNFLTTPAYLVSLRSIPHSPVLLHNEGKHEILLENDRGGGEGKERGTQEEMREAAPGVQVDLGELAAQAGAQQQEQNIVIREQT